MMPRHFSELKASLVGGGHRQTEGSYDGRTSSPTVDITHVLACLSLVQQLDAHIATIGIAATFLHADLTRKSTCFSQRMYSLS